MRMLLIDMAITCEFDVKPRNDCVGEPTKRCNIHTHRRYQVKCGDHLARMIIPAMALAYAQFRHLHHTDDLGLLNGDGKLRFVNSA